MRFKTPEEEEAYWEKVHKETSKPGYYDKVTKAQKEKWLKDMEEAEEEEDEWIETQSPDPEICPCMDCEWREPDRRYGKSREIESGALLNLCSVYGTAKPQEVLWEGEPCPYYMKEKTPKPVKVF